MIAEMINKYMVQVMSGLSTGDFQLLKLSLANIQESYFTFRKILFNLQLLQTIDTTTLLPPDI